MSSQIVLLEEELLKQSFITFYKDEYLDLEGYFCSPSPKEVCLTGTKCYKCTWNNLTG